MTALIVDDERAQIDGMLGMIGKLYPQVKTRWALNGREALAILEEEPVDVVFTDIRMPIMDGLELMKLWRSRGNPVGKPPYFVIFSGFDEFAYAQIALRYGALDYQLKPLDLYGISRMFERVLGSSLEKPAEGEASGGEEDLLIRQIRDYLLGHMDEKLSLEEVAVRFSYHPNYFSSLWRRRTSVPFSTYVQELKMNKAAALLETTALKVAGVAQQVGYGDEKYFCRVFKKHTGLSPQTYRRSKRMEVG